ncbi:unnamed protein product [Taenia asiatica]|uniref:GST N-terminal domain-containing protein n=1 Tax=Taenia asiatica TaxID=60517 RepID=A0A0R3WEM9_TAEAS|nr:unnamed protein product [Taenia asiatica]
MAGDVTAPNGNLLVNRLQIYISRYHIVRYLTEEEVAVRQQSGGGCGNELVAHLEHVGTYVIPEIRDLAPKDCNLYEFRSLDIYLSAPALFPVDAY